MAEPQGGYEPEAPQIQPSASQPRIKPPKLPANAKPPQVMQHRNQGRQVMTPEQKAEFRKQQIKALHKQITTALFRVVIPVVICMGFSVYLIHSQGSGSCRQQSSAPSRTYVPPGLDQYITSSVFPPPPGPPPPPDNTARLLSIILLSTFAGAIVVMTFVLVLLYKYHCEWILFIWLIISVITVLGYEGGLYLYEWSRSVCYPIDWVTLALLSWNFAVAGVIAIFWRSTRIIQQIFLIILSGLLAWVFSTWEEWAAWILLGLLVIWDLIAVLTPCGPLQLLIKAAKERGDPIPALVYDTNPEDVGRGDDAKSMFSVIQFRKKNRNTHEDDDEDEGTTAAGSSTGTGTGLGSTGGDVINTPAVATEGTSSTNRPGISAAGAVGMCVEVGNVDISPDPPDNSGTSNQDSVVIPVANDSSPPPAVVEPVLALGDQITEAPSAIDPDLPQEEKDAMAKRQGSKSASKLNVPNGISPPQIKGPSHVSPRQQYEEKTKVEKTPVAAVNGEQIGFLGAHLKLGLGDFVFYSLLVGNSSRTSVMTTVTCFVAILAGLCMTLFLLVMFRKPLPALPISITLGIIFNFVTKYTIQPFVYNLFPELLFT